MTNPGEGPEDLGRLGDQFIASLNHDIRTPLSGIVGMTDLLLETKLDDEQQEYVSTAKLCADQLLEMLNSALEYAALSAGTVRIEQAEFHLEQTLASIVAEFVPKAEAKGLTMSFKFDAKAPDYVLGDAVRLRQALAPLLANAVKFTRQGQVEVEVSTDGPTENERLPLWIGIRDTGIGIPPEKLKAIFQSFRQLESGLSRTYAGMGLGLAVARKLATMMGGEIGVESAPGVGSVFHLSVPVTLPAATSSDTDAADSSEGESAGRPKVLLVDDNDVARRVVTHVLRQAEYDIDCAEGGTEGIDAANRRRYDLILMDLQMPNVNGIEATAAIRRLPQYAGTPILALTANYSDEFMRACKEAGFQDFLSKPVQREDLLRAIKLHLS